MKLYIFQPSPNTRTVMAVVEHLGLEVETQTVNLMKGEQNQESFTALNPNAKTPTLVDGDFVLWESAAIAQYIAEKHESPLYPKDVSGRANVTRWMSWRNAHWQPPIGGLISEYLFKPMSGGAPDPEKVETLLGEFRTVAKVLDQSLENKNYLLGDAITIADFGIGSMLGFKDPCQLPLADYKNIQAWYSRLEALPAWQKTTPQLG